MRINARKSDIVNIQVYNHLYGGVYMTRKALNITIEPEVYEEFSKYAEKLGIRVSPWVAAKMKEFIEDEKEKELKKIQR